MDNHKKRSDKIISLIEKPLPLFVRWGTLIVILIFILITYITISAHSNNWSIDNLLYYLLLIFKF